MAKSLLRFLIACGALLLCNTALASGSTMNVRIWVQGGCSFVTSGDLIMNFGNLSQGDVTITATTPISCSNGTQFHISLSNGLNPNGQQRQMAQQNGSGRLPYSLTATPESGVSTGSNIDILLTAKVLQADYQSRPIGQYSDTVILTVEP
ncbi:Csu type fimbrial protein [Deefgea rivuli]|uniref:Csu type fimbrial protein n=1 Tax=Deefgea rivuli TaxID=400948 RepID=UPI00047F1820|nr:spore coat protein U domain-containing protein [Deefgea rivuli]